MLGRMSFGWEVTVLGLGIITQAAAVEAGTKVHGGGSHEALHPRLVCVWAKGAGT